MNAVVWFEIYVSDMNRAKKFYETVLDTSLEHLDVPVDDGSSMVVFPSEMESHGSSGALVKMDGLEPGGNSTLIYFHSEDCAIEEARVKAAGGKVFKPKMSIG